MLLEEKVIDFQKTGDNIIGKDILDVSYRLAEKIISKYKNFGYIEDLRSESHDAIISAVYAFSEKKETKFLTFCSRCIDNRIKNFIKAKNIRNKYQYREKPDCFTSITNIDIKNSLKDLSSNHFDCLIHGDGSRCMKYRAKKKLLNSI